MAIFSSPLLLSVLLLTGSTEVLGHRHGITSPSLQNVLAQPSIALNNVPQTVREHWVRRANAALVEAGQPCMFAAFASVIVNHTASDAGELVCTGINSTKMKGDPTLHGEIAAIQNCTAILTDPMGPYNLTGTQAIAAFADLTLYTNAESCPMCASAIRWAGFREYVYGTSIATLIEQGWGQIRIPSTDIIRESADLPNSVRMLGGVLETETDPLFSWQFDPSAPCPQGCARPAEGGSCVAPSL
ncbi:hypothetical protein VTO73DRAFT_13067 [Trametes versicolor]